MMIKQEMSKYTRQVSVGTVTHFDIYSLCHSSIEMWLVSSDTEELGQQL